jgi:hypothetical protein
MTNSGLTLGPFVSSEKNLMSPALLCGIPALSFFFLLLMDCPPRYGQFPLKGLLCRFLLGSAPHEVGQAELLPRLFGGGLFLDEYLAKFQLD